MRRTGRVLFLSASLAVMIGSFNLAAQTINITGRIINSDGNPVSQAQIVLMQAGIAATSNADGTFNILNTGFDPKTPGESNISFDGRRLYLNCATVAVYVTVYDLSGKEIVQIISDRVLSGEYALYPGSYVDNNFNSALVVNAIVGKEISSFLFIPDDRYPEGAGLIELSSGQLTRKTAEVSYSTFDTLKITHSEYQEKKIPIDCEFCSLGDIIAYEKIPVAPSDLTGTSETYSSIKLQWVDNSTRETGFRIERSGYQIIGWSDFVEVATVSSNITEYTDIELIQGSSYKYRIQAYNNGGSSAYSGEIVVTTLLSNPLSISGPLTSSGTFDLTVTYSWPGTLGSTSDRIELEESTSPTSGFTKIDETPWGERPTTYTFTLTKPSGIYYYRARATTLTGFTDYTEVISVSVNVPVQKAYLKVVNNTRYPMIDIRLNNQQQVGQGLGVLQGDSYTFEFSSSGQVNFILGVGFWDGSSRDVWFYNSGFTQVTIGTTTTITFNNPTIGQLLANFSEYRDWSGEYWVNLQMHMATFRFYSNGTWKLYDDGTQIGSGTVSLTSWPNNSASVKFRLCPSCDEITLFYPFGQFYYNNGPSSWRTIQYTAQ